MSEAHQADPSAGEGSSLPRLQAKKEEVEKEDFTFDEPCQKKQKTSSACMGRPKVLTTSETRALRNKLDMNWDLTEVLYYVMLQFIGLTILPFVCKIWQVYRGEHRGTLFPNDDNPQRSNGDKQLMRNTTLLS